MSSVRIREMFTKLREAMCRDSMDTSMTEELQVVSVVVGYCELVVGRCRILKGKPKYENPIAANNQTIYIEQMIFKRKH